MHARSATLSSLLRSPARATAALPWLLAAACGDARPGAPAAAHDAGAEDATGPDAADDDAGAVDEPARVDAGSPADEHAGGPLDLSGLVAKGSVDVGQRARPEFGALLAVGEGARRYVLESRRDAEPGPFGLPWRSRFRVVAYEGDAALWSFAAEPDDAIGDVTVHPSGDITLALQRQVPERHAYELVRLSAAGQELTRTVLADLTTLPDGDLAAGTPRPLFRMKAALADATSAGWLRLAADGEDVWAAVLSFVDVPAEHPLRTRMVSGLARFGYDDDGYTESWARLVDGPHDAAPAAWAYDELRWREQAVRPFLAVDPESGEPVVARAWNRSRCEAHRAAFAEPNPATCADTAADVLENERLPLAVTRFSDAGVRGKTVVLAPDADALEQLPFALAVRGGELAVVGSVVRADADGARRTYPDAGGNVDYDGYAARYDAQGALLRERDFDLGRGDVLSALRLTDAGIVAVGAAGWDRWQGGMSISRGADPLIVWWSADGEQSVARVVPLSDGQRHFSLHDLHVSPSGVEAYGFADAPMTHSADGGRHGERSFGFLRVTLRR